MKDTYNAARYSAGLAVAAAESVLSGKQRIVYALCRPPGHHAENDGMMGYCYFNNAAFAADRLSRNGKKVAILDIDYHHGNGTQQLFYDRGDVLYVSLHADPSVAFPYGSGFSDERGVHEGLGYTRNFPLPKTATSQQYTRTLQRAIRVINKFKPDFLVLSLGFDTYLHDPIGNLGLVEKDYASIGRQVARNIKLPTIIIQEGGYNVGALGKLSASFLQGYLNIKPTR
jgi:acetoin utilization deacetylase AcuC-like enzyme